jgi:predicted negative regulator of RcsB-dependent stress response
VDDYLLSEREQWDALKRWIRENGPAILAGVAIAALVLGGYRWWGGRQNNADLAAGAMYIQMENAFAQGNRTQAFILLGDLERQYPSSPYADQAKLASARAFVEDAELDRAADELRDVMQHSHDSILQLIARQRLARVQIAQHQPAAALATLSGANPGALAPQYAEARGDAYFAMGNKSAALAQYRLARAGQTGGGAESGILDLEISDLAADASSPPAGASPATGVSPAATAASPATGAAPPSAAPSAPTHPR